jgi:3-dehydroquinate dehydratase
MICGFGGFGYVMALEAAARKMVATGDSSGSREDA